MGLMQYNSSATNQDIISDITDLLGGIGTADYSLNARTRSVNIEFSKVWTMVFEAYGGWKFVDDNLSSTSDAAVYADQTLTSGTSLYGLPTGAITVEGVAIKNSGGTYENLIPISSEDFLNMGGEARFTSTGVPRYYYPIGDVVRLVPAPNYTVASTGIRVYFGQDISTFAASDTTKVPGFASPFHRMLSLGAAKDFAVARNLTDRITILTRELADYEVRLKSFYSKRYFARFPARIRTGEDLVREFT